MKFPLSPATLLGAALLAVVLANTELPFFSPTGAQGYYRFEARMTSANPGTVQLFYDAGRGFTEADSSQSSIAAGTPTLISLPVYADEIRAIRFDPINNDARVTIEDAVIRRPDDSILQRFTPADFTAVNQIDRLTRQDHGVIIQPPPGANDPFLHIALGTASLPLLVSWSGMVAPFLWRGLPVFIGLLLVLLLWQYPGRRWHGPAAARLTRLRAWAVARPKTAVALMAAGAVVCSSYPVIFCGASYVSPNYGTTLLYNTQPTLPGTTDGETVDVRGADIGAIMWQHAPLSAVQSRALFHDFELPLWNRYNSGGTVLLGQGQTMFGDPLHFGVLLAGGASWAWDLKFLLAKWLLGLALGLVVLHTTRHLPAALLVGFASIFVGFFVFRVNHPAFFSFCYGPLVLYAWCLVTGASGRRGLWLSLLGLMAANWMLMVSGTAKEAYVSLFTMNFAGVLMLLCSDQPRRERLVRLTGAVAAGGVYLLLAAPVWLTFYDAIKASYSSYNAAFAFQLQPSLALGFFDEILLRPFWANEHVFNPSSNFLLLLGVLAYLVNLRAISANGYALGAGLGALFPIAFIFGLVPPRWIANWPFLGNIHHIDNSFGVGLIHLFAVLAGFGFASAAQRLGEREGRGDLALGGLLLGALVLPYLALTQVVQRSTYTSLLWGQSLPRSYFVWGSFYLLLAAAAGLALTTRHLLRRRTVTTGPLLIALACTLLLLWRHGMLLHSQFPAYTLNAAPRADFGATSPALQAVTTDSHEPARIAGFAGNFFPGWNDAYGLEGVGGPDALMNQHMRELQSAFAVERIWDWRLVVYPQTLPQHRAFYDLLNVRYYLGAKDAPAPAGAALTELARADLNVYRSETAWPRAFFCNRVTTYDRPEDFAALVRAGDHRPFAAVQQGDRTLPALPAGDPAGRTVVAAAHYRLTNNSTAFTVDAPSAGVIVLGEAWLPDDFIVTVNGAPADYFRVNHAFKGVAVPRGGTYEVTFRYRPHRFNLALGLGALGLAVVGGSGLWIRRSAPGPLLRHPSAS